MQIGSFEPRQLSDFARLQKPAAAGESEWRATVTHTFGAEADGSSPDQTVAPAQVASRKLSELLVAHTLREIMPAGGHDEGGLAFDTWRGMLADAIAQEVGPHVDLLSPIIAPDGPK